MAEQSNQYGLQRLKSKEARCAIIQKISRDLNLTPIIAEAFFQQFILCFDEHADVSLSSGKISYEAVAASVVLKTFSFFYLFLFYSNPAE